MMMDKKTTLKGLDMLVILVCLFSLLLCGYVYQHSNNMVEDINTEYAEYINTYCICNTENYDNVRSNYNNQDTTQSGEDYGEKD